jgi:hypothetical protein
MKVKAENFSKHIGFPIYYEDLKSAPKISKVKRASIKVIIRKAIKSWVS